MENNSLAVENIKERVLIIGSGIAGCTVGWLLAEAGYEVKLLEQLPEPFDGTSRGVRAINSAGRYPWSMETALECLHSVIALKRRMPFAFSESPMRFLVVDKKVPNPVAGVPPISFEEYLHFYQKVSDYYLTLGVKDKLLGENSLFFRTLDSSELSNFTNIVGGIETKEYIFDIENTRRTLLEALKRRKAEVVTNCVVRAINKTKLGYEVESEIIPDGTSRIDQASIVINAAGWNASKFSPHLQKYRPERMLRLQLFVELDASTELAKAYPFSFELIPGIIDYYLLADNATLLGYPVVIDTLKVKKGDSLVIPKLWEEMMVSPTNLPVGRVRELISFAKSTFMPLLEETKILRVRPGIATAFNHEPYKKLLFSHDPEEEFTDHYDIIPTKATHSLLLAEKIVRKIIANSIRKSTIKRVSPNLLKILDGSEISY